MSIFFPSITIQAYNRIIDIDSLNRDELHEIGKEILEDIIVGNFVHFRDMPINVTILEELNMLYAEKQVRGIDENFSEYNTGIRIQNSVPSSPLPTGVRYLTEKTFSGDVSGDIGESTFTYFLREILDIDHDNIGHLRPEKKIDAITPDFVISERNLPLESEIFREPYTIPLFAEVKSSTGLMDANRIRKGLSQLQTVMRLKKNSHGLLFLLYRNNGSTYQGLLIGVKS